MITENFSFVYAQKAVDASTLSCTRADEHSADYITEDGLLKITRQTARHGYAVEWVLWLEAIGTQDTELISSLYDCDVAIPFEADPLPASRAIAVESGDTMVYNPNGSTWTDDEFTCDVEKMATYNRRFGSLYPGDKRHVANKGGRSSEDHLPFFDINRRNDGVIFAIGWTGQWQCDLSRNEDGAVRIMTGIEGVSFVLHPGERIRTSSILMMPYHDGRTNAHNRFRRLVRDHYSLIGKTGRDTTGPLCNSFWGGLTSEVLAKRIRFLKQEDLGFEYAWVDAGWYGNFTTPSANEFEGDWWSQNGDWNANPNFHPDDLEDVSRAAGECGMGFLLWVEPERVFNKTKLYHDHPEFLLPQPVDNRSFLLDLGNENAWNYVHTLLKNLIARLNIRYYRQDFNMNPLDTWRHADHPFRKGIHEIRHIMGLYRLWDTLLEEFPHLMIDNCASGGRRIDIETLRRSVPLWRSDYQCPANHDPDIAQNHGLGLSSWIPYHGTSMGRLTDDTYRARSCYAPCFGSNAIYSASENPDALSRETIDWLRATISEYKTVRPFLDKDFYPLTSTITDKQSWCAMQYHDPAQDAGILLAFRRAQSPYPTAEFQLGGLNPDATYLFRDADSGITEEHTGAELTEGYALAIPAKRMSRLLFYTRKG